MTQQNDPSVPLDGNMSFEAALAQLESIVRELESGDVPLDASIAKYERGEQLRAFCQTRLDQARSRIEKISLSRDGAAIATEPLDPQ